MKRKIFLTVLFMMSLVTISLPWFGGNHIETVYGWVLLDNPIALTCIVLAFFGIWTDYGKNSEIIGSIGMIGIIAMQIYEFLTWHIISLSGHFDLGLSIDLCYPEFYFSLGCVFVTYVVFRYIYKKINLTQSNYVV
jgi:hypothetical protein